MHKDCDPFTSENRARQSNTISSKQFAAFLNSRFRKLNYDLKRIRISGEYLNQSRFLNDIVIIADNLEELKEIFSEHNEPGK